MKCSPYFLIPVTYNISLGYRRFHLKVISVRNVAWLRSLIFAMLH